MTQTGRLEFRVEPGVKARIEAAATLMHESVSDFARAAVRERADEVLSRSEVTVVPPDFFDALLDELDAPAERNERFSAAAGRAETVLRYPPPE